MDTSLKKIKRFLNKHKKLIYQVFKTTLVFIYAAFFVIASYQCYYSLSFTNLEDFYYQQGIDKNENVYVIGITDADIEKLDETATSIAVNCATYLNKDNQIPASIGLDISFESITTEAEEILYNNALVNGNIVLPARLSIDESLMLDSWQREDTEIIAETQILPSDKLQSVVKLSHNLQITDKSGVVRQTVFSVEGLNGKHFESLPYVCYKMYAAKNNIETFELTPNSRNAAVVKFAHPNNRGYVISASDLLEGKVDTSEFKDKIVLIGYYSTSLDYGYTTSISYTERMHTVSIDANIINNLLEEKLDSVIDYRIQLHILIVMIIIMAFFSLKSDVLSCVVLNAVYGLLLLVFSFLCYGIGYQSFILPHIFNMVITTLLFGYIGYKTRSNKERYNLKKYLSQYIDIKIVENVIENDNKDLGVGIYKGDKVKTENIAVLFADIRGFTKISENIQPNDLVEMLNDYLSMMAECVNKYGGTLDKFIGDCAMAYWGSPVHDEDAVYHACLAASEMQRRAAQMLRKEPEYEKLDIKIGIGINYGEAVVGNIGSTDRKNFTAVGDTVNIASRIEELVPGGKTYISESAARQLSGNPEIQLEKINETITLRGKKSATGIYDLKSISVHDIKKDEEVFRFRGNPFAATIVNSIIFFVQLVFSFNYIRKYGIDFASYFNVTLAIISCAIMAAMIVADINATTSRKKEYRPKWLDILFLTALAANLKCFVAYAIRGIPTFGVAAISGDLWPGGMLISVLCPLLMCISFFFFEYQVNYKVIDVILAELPLAAILLFSTLLAYKTKLNFTNPKLFNIYFRYPLNIISIVLECFGVYMLTTINKNMKLQEKLQQSKMDYNSLSVKKQSAFKKIFDNDKSRRIIFLILNAFIFVASLRGTYNCYLAGGIEIYSNPSLVGILVCICSIVQMFAMLYILIFDRKVKIPTWYNYLSFIKSLGCWINFFSVLILAINGYGIMTLFEVHWGADFTVYLICPILSLFMMAIEKHEFKFTKCLLLCVPFLAIVYLSRGAIIFNGLEVEYAAELNNFYSPEKMIITIASEFLVSSVLYLFNNVTIRLGRISNRISSSLALITAGTRKGIAGDVNETSEFGMYSDCYILKDNKYAIVIGAGSGVIDAVKHLKDCEQIDVLLANRRFDGMSGFLSVPNLNKYANIRIFSPFDFDRFSMHPFWPVDAIDGSRVQVELNKRFRLNSTYSFAFIENKGSEKFIVKVYGEQSIGASGKRAIIFSPIIPTDINLKKELAEDAYALVFTNYPNWMDACYYAIDFEIPKTLISGYRYKDIDEDIKKTEVEARKILYDVEFARKERVYIVY